MNKLIKDICVLSAIAAMVVVQGCKKPKLPEDPCLNPVTASALQPDAYCRGHFSYVDDKLGMFWLYVTNWNQFANKVQPGRQYKIGYVEVQCPDDKCGNYLNGMQMGGCFIARRKCIIIKCLNEIKDKGCNETLMDPLTFNDAHSVAVSSTGITGSSLSVKAGFSGCGADYDKSFKLYLLQFKLGARVNDIFAAKAVNTYKGDIACLAYSEKDVCFDLSAIRTYYMNGNVPVPALVTIRLEMGNSYQDFTYNP